MRSTSFGVRYLSGVAIAVAFVALTSCSTGPEPPKVGTPAFYWSAAKETYAAGDYQKTIQHLEAACKTQNEFTSRAQAWLLVLTSGMAKGYMDLADQFEYGAKAARGNPTPFRRQLIQFRTYANQLALQFAHVFEDFEKANKDEKIPLDFAYPSGSALPAPQLTKIADGNLPAPAVLDDVVRQHLRTSVLLAATRAVGATDDTAKAQEMFKTLPVQVPREVFLLELANALNDQAQLFSRPKLDQPDRLKLFASHALDIVKTLPPTKDTKTLTGKIQKTLKSVKAE